MQIAIMGTGNVGRALGIGWSKAGHQVIYGTRDAQADKVQALLAETGGTATGFQAALDAADVVLLAIPWSAVAELMPSLNGWEGKTLIDATNPIAPGFRKAVESTSGAELIARLAAGAHVIKAFNTTSAENMLNPVVDGKPMTMFIAGDEPTAKATTVQLARDLGFAVEDVGALNTADLLEGLAMLWIRLAIINKQGRNIALQLVRR